MLRLSTAVRGSLVHAPKKLILVCLTGLQDGKGAAKIELDGAVITIKRDVLHDTIRSISSSRKEVKLKVP